MELIISNKMKENNVVVTRNDPNYLKYFHVRVVGNYRCGICGNEWTCHNATIAIDLYSRKVSKKYKQFCKGCHEWCGDLHFTNKRFERIADRVIGYYKKRKEAGGTVPAIENEPYSYKVHEESDCERCCELDEPCWLHLVPYIKKVPYDIAHLVHSSLSDISEPLKKLYAIATMEGNDVSKISCININPLSGSEDIKQWRKQCETLLESFLLKFNSVSLSVQPNISKMVLAQSNPSVSVELQAVLHITGDKKKVAEAFKRVETAAKDIEVQYEAEKCKPCIIPW